jgi:succinate-acetate transporter protein
MAQYSAERAESAAPAIANPGPLGLSAFALTTFTLSATNAGFIVPYGTSALTIVVGIALFYGGIVQLVAGVQEFRRNNTFAATAFCSYGGFWLAVGFSFLPGTGILAALIATRTLSSAFTVFLLGWTVFTLLMLIATFRISGALVVLFGLLFLTFLALTIGWWSGTALLPTQTWIQIGGWLGIVTALVALYTALAQVLESVKLPVLPTLPLS